MEEEKKIPEEAENAAEREMKQETESAETQPENGAAPAETNGKKKSKEKKKGKKKFGPVKLSACILSGAVVLAAGIWACIAFLRPQVRNDVDLGYGSVSYEVRPGEVFSASAFTSQMKDRDEKGVPLSGSDNTYDGLDVFGRLNWTFAQRDNWKSEMHSTVHTAIGLQDVSTYKRFSNGILISSDITTSRMVNVAREYCYVNDERVIWRESAQDKSQWNGINTVFSEGAPLGNMDIYGDEGFRKLNGLPATELSVYVFEQNTIESATLSAAENIPLSAGRSVPCFTVTYRLRAVTDEEGKTGAAAYYGNQMVFTGGIDAPPEFEYIEVGYTFTENWLPVRCTVSEKYTASMKTIVSTCTSTSETTFEYDVPGIEEEVQQIYHDYYEPYAGSEATGQTQRPLNTADCLASAFSPLLNEPSVLDLSLTVDENPLHGSLYLDLGGGSDLSAIEARLQVGDTLYLLFDEGSVFLKYSDVKLSMTASEFLSLLGGTETAGGSDPLAELMDGEFTYTATSAELSSSLHLGGLTLSLKFNFSLDGDRNASLEKLEATLPLKLDSGATLIDSSVQAEVSFGGEAPEALSGADRKAYTDIGTYVKTLKDIFTSEVIRTGLSYSAQGYTLDGTVDIALGNGDLCGDFTFTGDGVKKQIYAGRQGDTVYVALDDMKIKTSLSGLLGYLGGAADIVTVPQPEGSLPLGQLLTLFLSSDFARNFSSAKEDNALLLTLKGTEILRSFGLEYELGDIELSFGEKFSASALGATVEFAKGETFTFITDGYTSIDASFMDKIIDIVSVGGISLNGEFVLDGIGTKLVLAPEECVITWKNGFELRTDIVLAVGETSLLFNIHMNAETIEIACGNVGVKIVFGEFGRLWEAFASLEAQIQHIIDEVTGNNLSPDPSAAETLALAESGEILAALGEKIAALLETFGTFDPGELLSRITFSSEADKLLFTYSGLTVALLTDGEDLTVLLDGKTESGISLTGRASASAFMDELPAMPEAQYLGTEEFIHALDYLGSAVDLLNATDYTLSVNGETTVETTAQDTEPADAAKSVKTKYTIEASLRYHRGEKFPVQLDVDNTILRIDPNLFLNVSLALISQDESAQSLYLDLFIVDGAPEKDGEGQLVTDGNLDFYVALSQFAPTDERYNPLRIYAPADEIMTILSGAVAMLGVNVELLDNYLVYDWLSLETVMQLEAFTPLISDLLSGLIAGLLPQMEQVPSMAAAAEHKNYIRILSITEEAFKLALNSEDVYGKPGLADLTVTISREGGRFNSITFENVYDKTGAENTTLTAAFGYETVTPDIPQGTYVSFLGAERLLLSLAKSATHAEEGEIISGENEQHTYALNQNFYIDGSINARLDLLIIRKDIRIDIIAISVSVDETGALGVNLRLEYQAVNAGAIIAINGDGKVDITIKNGMVYIKRVQTSYYEVGLVSAVEHNYDADSYLTLYRAMPMENFMNDILGQFGFILNLNERIMEEILKNAGSSTEPDPEQPAADYGTRLSEVLKQYVYTPAGQDDSGNATAAKWEITLNGDALVSGVLGDMSIVIAEDTDGYIHDLNVHMTVVTVITADLSLRWRNPGGAMEQDAETGEPVPDLTQDISEEINRAMGAMIEKLNGGNGWDDPATADISDGPLFLEAKPFTVRFECRLYDGGENSLGSQDVFVSTGADGNPANILYGTLPYPALPENDEEFTYQWLEEQIGTGDTLPADGKLYAEQKKQLYTVTFYSPTALDETWEYDEGRGMYYKTFDMEYGAKIMFLANGEPFGNAYTVTGESVQEVILPEIPAYPDDPAVKGEWSVTFRATGTEFTVLYKIDTVNYHSDVAFAVNGKENTYENYSEQFTESSYTLIIPTAEGFTFLGWYGKGEDGKWTKIDSVSKGESGPNVTEVYALWAQDGFVTLTTQKNGTFTVNYTATATVDGTNLMGALAADIEESAVKYEFVFNREATSAEYQNAYGDANTANASRGLTQTKYTHVHVKVQITYTLLDGTEITVEYEQHAAF